MVDAIFEDPRLAQIYDPLDPDRSDLDVYVRLVDELGARSVLDLGCGTGTFACALARRGIDVTAVDPAGASLDVARAKPGAEAVRWLQGDATIVPPRRVEAAFMTANVAQVFLTEDDWHAALRGIWHTLRPRSGLVFETHRPAGLGTVDSGDRPDRRGRAGHGARTHAAQNDQTRLARRGRIRATEPRQMGRCRGVGCGGGPDRSTSP